MTLNEEILQFVGKLVTWSSNAGVRLAELDQDGLSSSKEAQKILKDTKDVIELMGALYVTDIQLVDDDDNIKYSYLTDSDDDIRQLMEDWSYYLKLDTLPVGLLPLDGQYYIVESQVGTIGSGLPSGGGANYILSQDSAGNPIWILKPTLFEVDETV